MMVKICGIMRREDAEAAAEAGADAIGFIFHKASPRYVTPEQARELGDGLNVSKIGVFVDASIDQAVMDAAGLDVAQVYGSYSIRRGIRFWSAVRVPIGGGGLGFGSKAEALFLDSAVQGVPFDWNIAGDIAQRAKVIVAGGLDDANVAQAIRVAHPWGVDASSKLESAPGIKDHEKVRRFIEAARRAS